MVRDSTIDDFYINEKRRMGAENFYLIREFYFIIICSFTIPRGGGSKVVHGLIYVKKRILPSFISYGINFIQLAEFSEYLNEQNSASCIKFIPCEMPVSSTIDVSYINEWRHEMSQISSCCGFVAPSL